MTDLASFRLFAGVDEGELAAVSLAMGKRMVDVTDRPARELSRYPDISAQAFVAGVVHAHLCGAATALAAADRAECSPSPTSRSLPPTRER